MREDGRNGGISRNETSRTIYVGHSWFEFTISSGNRMDL